MSNGTIAGRVALVTGANRGIGRAITEALLEAGAAKVYAGTRRPEAVADLVEKYGALVVPIVLDVTNQAQIDAAVETAPDVELLINNAGVAEKAAGAFGDSGWVEAGRREFEVNALGTLAVTQAFAPTLARNGGGTIANIVSVAGMVNFPIFMSYSLSKAALHSLTQSSRIMLAEQGTTVIGVYPGPIDTELAKDAPWDKVSPAHAAERIVAGIEAGVEEIFPDPMAEQLGELFSANPKGLEQQIAAMAQEGAAA